MLATVTGPIVLVGHSYGGEVITNAALGNTNVKALGYVAAFGPDKGESVGSIGAQFPGGLSGAHTIEIDSSHVAMISHPGAVTDLILGAVRAAD